MKKGYDVLIINSKAILGFVLHIHLKSKNMHEVHWRLLKENQYLIQALLQSINKGIITSYTIHREYNSSYYNWKLYYYIILPQKMKIVIYWSRWYIALVLVGQLIDMMYKTRWKGVSIHICECVPEHKHER